MEYGRKDESMNIQQIIKDSILHQKAYEIEDTACRVKLDANENPYGLTPVLQQRLCDYMKTIPFNRYPDPGSRTLRMRLARHFGVDQSMIIIGNGSDELIQILLTAFNPAASGGVVIPCPTFAMYKISALNAGHRVLEVPLDDRFDLDLDAMLEVLARTEPHLVFLSYPNNPTGNCFDRHKIETILNASKGPVVVDEAYYNFSGRTFLTDLARWDNLIILRTLSKVGFAAVRVGILIAQPDLAHELNKVRLPYNMNALSQAAALFYLENEQEFLRQVEYILTERDVLAAGLHAIDTLHPFPTDANFVLFSCDTDENKLYSTLLSEGFLIKHFASPEVLRRCMRVTVGSEGENREFLDALRNIIRR